MVEYAFIIVLIATILVGVLILAGTQLEITMNDVRTDVGIALSGGQGPDLSVPHTCADGTTSVWRHNKYRCSNE
jgi:Flp pilus assembly pilin Flp